MKLWISKWRSDEKAFMIDFIPEVAVPTPSLYILIYKFKTHTWIIKDGKTPDVKTDDYSVFYLTRLQHIIYGHFYHENKKIGAQVGCYARREGVPGLIPILLSHDFGEIFFKNAVTEVFYEESDHLIVDLEDFNEARKLIGQKEYTLTEYLAKKLSKKNESKYGLNLNDETSLFSISIDKFDPSEIMTSKGMEIFLEEQEKKDG